MPEKFNIEGREFSTKLYIWLVGSLFRNDILFTMIPSNKQLSISLECVEGTSQNKNEPVSYCIYTYFGNSECWLTPTF